MFEVLYVFVIFSTLTFPINLAATFVLKLSHTAKCWFFYCKLKKYQANQKVYLQQ